MVMGSVKLRRAADPGLPRCLALGSHEAATEGASVMPPTLRFGPGPECLDPRACVRLTLLPDPLVRASLTLPSRGPVPVASRIAAPSGVS
jgi:hypothetical protein